MKVVLEKRLADFLDCTEDIKHFRFKIRISEINIRDKRSTSETGVGGRCLMLHPHSVIQVPTGTLQLTLLPL